MEIVDIHCRVLEDTVEVECNLRDNQVEEGSLQPEEEGSLQPEEEDTDIVLDSLLRVLQHLKSMVPILLCSLFVTQSLGLERNSVDLLLRFFRFKIKIEIVDHTPYIIYQLYPSFFTNFC